MGRKERQSGKPGLLLPLTALMLAVAGYAAASGGSDQPTWAITPQGLAGLALLSAAIGFIVWLVVHSRGRAVTPQRGQRARAALEQQARLTRLICDHTADALFVCNADGHVVFINPAAERLTGWRLEDFPQANLHHVIHHHHPDGRVFPIGECAAADFRRTRATLENVEDFVCRRDGTFLPVSRSTIPIIVDGEVAGVLLTMQDMSARRRAEEALAEAERVARSMEAKFRTIFEQAAVGIEQVGFDGRLLEVNQKLCDILGYSREELLQKTTSQLTAPEDRAMEETHFAPLFRGEHECHTFEKRCVRKDGSTVWTRVTSSLVRDAGEPFRISVVEDISVRKAAEAESLRARRAAERAMAAKANFLASASHDLRQPAQAISLFTSVLEGRPDPSTETETLAMMRCSVDAMQTLLDAYLEVSRLDAGLVNVTASPVNLGKLICRLSGRYRPKIEAKGLRLRVMPRTAWVRTDGNLVERILSHIMDNAIRFTPKGGILIGCRRRGAGWSVEVVDTGVGMAEPQLRSIFQDFYQIGNPERNRQKGLGLGLGVVQRLTSLLDIPVQVKSRPGSGSRFSFWLPATSSGEGVSTRSAEGQSQVVLVIDDERLVRRSLGALIREWGCTVLTAADGEESVRMIQSEGVEPDFIVADYRLCDGRTGVMAVREVELALGRHIPSVILTADTAPERVVEARKHGLPILHKPVRPHRLRELISRNAGSPDRVSGGVGSAVR